MRKLVKKLNELIDGFYTPPIEPSAFNIRCNRARIRYGKLQVKQIGGEWFEPKMNFHDAYGQDIT